MQALTLRRTQPTVRSTYPSVSPLRSIDFRWYRNLNLLSIAYDLRPRLRSRLTLSGRTFLRKPWAFDGQDSHLTLATHADILPSVQSTAPSGTASARTHCSSTDTSLYPVASVAGLAPLHLRRTFTRPVSYYALFQCVAASKPTSWLSAQLHILFHLTCTLGP